MLNFFFLFLSSRLPPNPTPKSCILHAGTSKHSKIRKLFLSNSRSCTFHSYCWPFRPYEASTACHWQCQTSRLRCGFLPASSRNWSQPARTASPWEGTPVAWVWLQLLLITDDQELILCPVSRQGINHILLHRWTVFTLFMGTDCSELRCFKPSNQMLWLISFSCEALARGDRVRGRGRTWPHTTQQMQFKKL